MPAAAAERVGGPSLAGRGRRWPRRPPATHHHQPSPFPPPPPSPSLPPGVRCIVTLECTEARAEGATPTRYTTQKNKKNTPERLEIKKYNKHLKRHTVHKEIK